MRYVRLISAAAATGALMAFLAVSGTHAAQESECKGLAEQKCTSVATCSWVRSYTTAKGTEVKAFCRRKPVRKQTTQAAPAQPNGT